MADIKQIISRNISSLRSAGGMTQLELAEKLNYSDKAVSKWERGESVPDIAVLVKIADLFSVPLDYLVRPDNDERYSNIKQSISGRIRNHGFITGVSILFVWLLATFIFVVSDIALGSAHPYWLTFVYAVPASMIVWLVLNSIWFNRRRNFLIVSFLMWSVLISVHLTLLPFGFNVWLIFILGIPGQIIIFMWSRITLPGAAARAANHSHAK